MLVRRPIHIVRGGRIDRGTTAVISWTRRSRVHVISVYNAHEGDPQHEDTTRELFAQLQGYVAELGSVPWLAGGDWNLEPRDAEAHWDRRPATIHYVGAATHTHGRNIDWMVAGHRAPTWGAETYVVPGTDHVGVQVKLQAVDANTLRVRMELPTRIFIDKGAKEVNAEYRAAIQRSLGEPPADWDTWTHAAEEGILAGMQIPRTSDACRGGAVS